MVITRNPMDVAGRTLTFAYVAIVSGLLFFNLSNDVTGLLQRASGMFAMLFFYMVAPYISMSLFTSDKSRYLADVSAKLYRPLAYYLAKVGAMWVLVCRRCLMAICQQLAAMICRPIAGQYVGYYGS